MPSTSEALGGWTLASYYGGGLIIETIAFTPRPLEPTVYLEFVDGGRYAPAKGI